MSLAEKKAQVKAKLAEREASMARRYNGFQGGVEDMSKTVQEDLLGNPLIKLGGVMLAGVIVGLILGKRKNKSLYAGLSASAKPIVDQYIHVLRDAAVSSGVSEEKVREVVLEALQNRVPILVENSSAPPSSGLLRSLLRGVMRTAVPFAIQAGLNHLADKGGWADMEGSDGAEALGE